MSVANIEQALGKLGAEGGKDGATDGVEIRKKAEQARAGTLINPGDEGYDEAMRELWGGPPPRFFDEAMQHTDYQREFSTQPVALVTGGGGGIGFYISKGLAQLGYHVIIPARDGPARAESEGAMKAIRNQVPDAMVTVPETPLDLDSLKSVRAFSVAIAAHPEVWRLDVLSLNAGRGGGASDPREVTEDGLEAIMQINTAAQVLLTAELMPLLRASPDVSRVLYHSSIARFMATPFKSKSHDVFGTNPDNFSAFDQYALSKAGGALFLKSLNERLLAYGINNVVGAVVDPGLAATGVNIQHDLTKSAGITGASTNDLHDSAAHHAADGALPMILAAVTEDIAPNDWFTTAGVVAETVQQMAHRQDCKTFEKADIDPMNEEVWPRELREAMWEQFNEVGSINWDQLLRTLE